MTSLQTQLEQSRLRETELLGALKEMQDKVLDLEKVRYRGENRDHRVDRVQYLQALLLDGNLMYMVSRYWFQGTGQGIFSIFMVLRRKYYSIPPFLID